ncbi:hypothetical protein ACWC24_17455 [Streptomyces sp. NPDC001443]
MVHHRVHLLQQRVLGHRRHHHGPFAREIGQRGAPFSGRDDDRHVRHAVEQPP